eukprot:CFRG2457T1
MPKQRKSPPLRKCVQYDDAILDCPFELVLAAVDLRLHSFTRNVEYLSNEKAEYSQLYQPIESLESDDCVQHNCVNVLNVCHADNISKIEDHSSHEENSALHVSEVIREIKVPLDLPAWLLTMLGRKDMTLRQQAVVDRGTRTLKLYSWSVDLEECLQLREVCEFSAVPDIISSSTATNLPKSIQTRSDVQTTTVNMSRTLITRKLDLVVRLLPGIDAVVEWHVVKMHSSFVQTVLGWLENDMKEVKEHEEYQSWSAGQAHSLGDGRDATKPWKKFGTCPEASPPTSDVATKIITTMSLAPGPPTTMEPITSLCGSIEIPPPISLHNSTITKKEDDTNQGDDDSLAPPAGRMLKSGYLLKYTNFLNGWQDRYFCLERCTPPNTGAVVINLVYYENENDMTRPRGKMAVNGLDIEVVKGTVGEFTVSNGTQTFPLCARSDKHRREWLVALGSAKAHDRLELAPYATLPRTPSLSPSTRPHTASSNSLSDDNDANASEAACGIDDEREEHDAFQLGEGAWADLLSELEMHDELLRNQTETINQIVGQEGTLSESPEQFQEQCVLFRAASKSLLTVLQDAIATTAVQQDLQKAKLDEDRVKRSQLKLKIQNATLRHKQLSKGLEVTEPPPRPKQKLSSETTDPELEKSGGGGGSGSSKAAKFRHTRALTVSGMSLPETTFTPESTIKE